MPRPSGKYKRSLGTATKVKGTTSSLLAVAKRRRATIGGAKAWKQLRSTTAGDLRRRRKKVGRKGAVRHVLKEFKTGRF